MQEEYLAEYEAILARKRCTPFQVGSPLFAESIPEGLLKQVAGDVRIRPEHFSRHMAVMGVSGSGKSKWLEAFAQHLIDTNNGFTFIDPHGDTADAIACYAAESKRPRQPFLTGDLCWWVSLTRPRRFSWLACQILLFDSAGHD